MERKNIQINKETFDQRMVIQDFLDWASEKDHHLCQDFTKEHHFSPKYHIVTQTRLNRLIDSYLGIDTDELEQERRALLEDIQKSQEAADQG